MDCTQCEVNILEVEDICFFIKSKENNIILLIVKDERIVIVEKKFYVNDESNKKPTIICPRCNSPLGSKNALGPNKTIVYSFGTEKIILLNRRLKKKTDPWHKVYTQEPFNVIEVRSHESFFGSIVAKEPSRRVETICHLPQHIETITWPDTNDLSHFRYNDILTSPITPRNYQIAAYIEALQRNLIIILPTGSGKTLIATIIAAKMLQLNPNHMVLFIVERVPLVFQQGEAISCNTRLSVCCYCSETNSSNYCSQLKSGEYDILVSTAGAYLNLEKEIGLTRFCCVILDECHHATGEHGYVKILDLVRKCGEENQPRVVGLTASPPSGSMKGDINEAITRLVEFISLFLGASIYYNESFAYISNDSTEKVTVPTSTDEVFGSQIRILVEELHLFADYVNKLLGNIPNHQINTEEDWKEPKNRINLMRVLENLSKFYAIDSYIKPMKAMCTALDITDLLGITYATQSLENLSVYSKLNREPLPSPRLSVLLSILEKLSEDSKIIVFVQTRQIAQIITTVLKQIPSVEGKFSPQKIVGQHGQLGMEWENEQKEILDAFRSGNCNLLVSTSVVEEGLDVPACDVVIRFDGIKSLLSYKQSKGRARKWDSSRFILLLSQSEEKIFDDIQASDMILRTILEAFKKHTNVPSQLTLNMQRQIESEKSKSPVYNSVQPSECAVELYFTGICNLIDVQDILADLLREKYFLKMKHIDQANHGSQWKSKGIFPPEDSVIIVGIQSQSNNIYQRYNKLSIEWKFALNNDATNVWSRLEVSVKDESESIVKLPVRNILWGNFIAKNAFQFNPNISSKFENLDLDFMTKHSISIQIDHRTTVEIFLPSIHQFMLLDWKESEVTLFIPLNSCPFVQYACLGEAATSDRMTSDNCELLRIFSKCSVIAITITYTNSEWYPLWTLLHSSTEFPVPLFDSRVTISISTGSIARTQLTSSPLYQGKPMQDCLWIFSVLKCCRNIYLPEHSIDIILQTIEANLNELGIEILTNTISRIVLKVYDVKAHYFFDLTQLFISELKFVRENIRYYAQVTPPNYCYIESAIVTPSRVVCVQPVLTQNNRLYRKFSDERFLNLAFREEKGGPLPQDKSVINRVQKVMMDGIDIDGNKFYFLTCSGSQLRSKRAIFIHIRDPLIAFEKVAWIRSQLLGQTIINNEIKYLSRLGLFSTSDYPSCAILESDTESLRDLVAEDGLMLTDGAGKIRRSFAVGVVEKVKPIYPDCAVEPSALQVRLAGLKGVLTIVDEMYDPDFRNVQRNCKIIYRDSMKKIEWTEPNLGVVKFSEYNELFLNMQMITLLTSLERPDGEWDPKPRLRELYKLYLEDIAMIFTDYQVAQNELVINLPNYLRETNTHFDILSEPYFLSLLRCIYTSKIQTLIEKARLPMRDGCLLMGIPDPIGVLQDGEIFVQIQRTAEEKSFYLDGRMLVYKNPCLHPGDLLTPTGVYKPELAHLKNVIVFPIQGRTSLPASTSGGDLDGDMFAIIWDSVLIPPPDTIVEPLNYDKVLEDARKGPKQKPDVLVGPAVSGFSDEALANAYCKVIRNDLLGIISHLHMSICDQMPDGARNTLSIKLAKAASLAVDYPKTGVMPEIPEKARKLIKENGYPDFMEKKECSSYPSTKLLGELYRMAKSVCFKASELATLYNFFYQRDFTQKLPGNLPIDDFKVKGYRKFMKDARMKYHDYSNAFQRILLSFGIKTEAEAMLALIIECHPLLSNDKGHVAKSLRAGVGYLIEEFREKFHRDISPDESFSKASAWYLTVYSISPLEEDIEIFCSFPWIVGEYLCEIAARSTRPKYSINLHKTLGQTAREYIFQNRDYIDMVVESKKSAFPKVKKCMEKFMSQRYPYQANTRNPPSILDISIYGSVSMFLCEPLSDLDVSISLTPYGTETILNSKELKKLSLKDKQRYILKVCAIPAFQDPINSMQDKTSSEVPIISISMDSPQAKSKEEISIDIAASSDGVDKSGFITNLYRVTGGLFFGWLWLLVHWARHVGILKSHNAPGNIGIILTAEFEALVLYIYNQMKSKPKYDERIPILPLKTILNNLMDSHSDQTLGIMLEEFFWLGAKLTENEPVKIVYEWPIRGKPTHTISKSSLKEISPLLFQGWHCLVYSRNISKLFEGHISELSIRKKFSLSMSDKLRQSTHFLKTQLSNKTGALIAFDQIGRHILISARGSASAIHKLSSEISSLENSTALTYKYKSVSNPYMLEGSFALVLVNQYCSPRVKIRSSQHDCFKLHHHHNTKSDVLLVSDTGDDDSEANEESRNWKRNAIARIQTLMWQQLSRFPVDTTGFLLKNLELKTRYGFFYILDGVDSFQSVGDSLSLEEFEQCLMKSKKFSKDFIDKFTESKTSEITDAMARTHLSDSPPKKKPIVKRDKPKKEVTKSISSAFCPGIQLTNDSSQLKKAQFVYKKALEACGFIAIDNKPQYTWRIDSKVTVSRDIRIDFDENLEVLGEISESPFIWVLATIVGDSDQRQKMHDIRLRVESFQPIDTTTPFYQRISSNLRNTDLLTLGTDGLPLPCEYLMKGLKIIKHNTHLQFYQHASSDVIAKVSSGTEFSGENIRLFRQYCELTLLHSGEELREAVKLVYGGREIRRIAEDAFEISHKVSEAISKFV